MHSLPKKQERLNCKYRTTESQRQAIIERRLNGESQAAIARDYDIHQSTVSRIVAEHLKANEEGNDNE